MTLPDVSVVQNEQPYSETRQRATQISHETRFVVGVVEVHVDGGGHVVHCQQHDEHNSGHFDNGLVDNLDRGAMKYRNRRFCLLYLWHVI